MVKKPTTPARLTDLDSYDPESQELNSIIDTPKGSRNKYAYDEEHGLFILKGVLPAGASFPFNFGLVPLTLGGDSDPVDVLVLMDESAFVGCPVPARLIGVIEAEQTEEGETTRNDRFIAVAANAHSHREVRSLGKLSENLIAEIEHFFISYNAIKGKDFKPIGRFGPERAKKLIEEGIKRFRQQRTGKKARRHRAGSGTTAKARSSKKTA